MRLVETMWGRLLGVPSGAGRLLIGPLPLRQPIGGGNQPPRRLPTCPTSVAFLPFLAFFSLVAQAQPLKDTFRIKYVAEGAVYIDGGRAAGLAEKMRLTVTKPPDITIQLEVVSVADSSAVCDIKTAGALLEPGDFAKLTSDDAQKSQMLRQMGSGNHYAQTITFTGGDPIDEEAREYVPHPPLPEVNRFRGRIAEGRVRPASPDVGVLAGPRVAVLCEQGRRVFVTPDTLVDGEAALVLERLRAALGGSTSTK